MRRCATGAVLLLLAVGLVGCGDDGDSNDGDSNDGAPDATEPVEDPLRVLLTNDDGFDAPGLDAVARALLALDEVELTVVAPSGNETATGDRTSEEPIADLVARDAETASGLPAVAVDGSPADSVRYALEVVMAGSPPHVVVSGSNQGHNVGPLAPLSGTVGAAREAARHGVPALAVSQGLLTGSPELDYGFGAAEAAAWVDARRDEVRARTPDDGEATVASLNVPTCPEGEVRGLVEAPLDVESDIPTFEVDCTSTLSDPASDVEAFVSGFAVLSEIPLDLGPA